MDHRQMTLFSWSNQLNTWQYCTEFKTCYACGLTTHEKNLKELDNRVFCKDVEECKLNKVLVTQAAERLKNERMAAMNNPEKETDNAKRKTRK
jgi:hypothetical protein